MLRPLLTTLILFIFTACTTSNILISEPPKKELLKATTILKIPVPVRQQGYENFKTQVITSQKEFDEFIKKVEETKKWQDKQNFIDALKLTPINFKKYNLLLYRMTENSGSTVLAVDAPSGSNKHVIVVIGRDKPNTGTSDMAYYTIAYKLLKSVEDVTFDNGVKKNLVKNYNKTLSKKGEVPENCVEWYDGCNDCGRVGPDGDAVCTERHCVRHAAVQCTKWK
jgi:hypothetical protein